VGAAGLACALGNGRAGWMRDPAGRGRAGVPDGPPAVQPRAAKEKGALFGAPFGHREAAVRCGALSGPRA